MLQVVVSDVNYEQVELLDFGYGPTQGFCVTKPTDDTFPIPSSQRPVFVLQTVYSDISDDDVAVIGTVSSSGQGGVRVEECASGEGSTRCPDVVLQPPGVSSGAISDVTLGRFKHPLCDDDMQKLSKRM